MKRRRIEAPENRDTAWQASGVWYNGVLNAVRFKDPATAALVRGGCGFGRKSF